MPMHQTVAQTARATAASGVRSSRDELRMSHSDVVEIDNNGNTSDSQTTGMTASTTANITGKRSHLGRMRAATRRWTNANHGAGSASVVLVMVNAERPG